MPKILQRTPAQPGILKASDLWRTEPRLFHALHAEFAFDIDLAANAEDHLCPAWLGPGSPFGEDALAVDWARLYYSLAYEPDTLSLVDRRIPWDRQQIGQSFRCGFLNPPYSSALIRQFMAKVVASLENGFTLVTVTPYTPDTVWWQAMQEATEIREIPHRVGYLKADGVTSAHAMFPSAIGVFRPQPGILRGEPRRVVWDYR